MEYVEGITFRELVEKKGGKIPAEELLPMVEPLFHALSIMHENGLIHRDISPDNLMLENGKVRLLDFGCAREASKGTETMTIALKHGYAPIEQYQQKGQGPWTDIYALSATIYYCLTGKIPPQALDRITEDELLLPSKLGIPISANQEKALLKGMKLQPNRRFASAEAMWRALYAQTEEEAGTENGEELVVAPRTAAVEEAVAEPRIAVDEEIVVMPKTAVGEENSAVLEEEADVTEQAAMEAPDWEKEAEVENESTGTETEAKSAADKKKTYIFRAGIAAVCCVVLLVVWLINRPAEKEAVKVVDSNTESGNENEEADASSGINSPLFENAVLFTGGNNEEFQALMEDDSVEAVILREYINVDRAVITKPVLLSEDVFWGIDSMIIDKEGYLQVEGRLNIDYSGYIRLCGNVPRISVVNDGVFWSTHAFVWMDDEACFAIEGDNGDESTAEHRLVFDEAVFTQNNVRSVTDFESLKRAVEEGQPISIDADITLEEDVNFSTPVRISEGVAVNTIQDGGQGHYFLVNAGAILVNNGKFAGNLNICNGGVVINNASMSTNMSDGYASLWVQDESTVINFGTMAFDDCGRFWEEALFVNMGNCDCYDLYLVGGTMVNLGNVTVMEGNTGKESRFDIVNGSILANKAGGTVTVKEAARCRNDSLISNNGEFVVGRGGSFDNTLFSNNGVFQIENGANVDIDRTGIYYGGGRYDIGWRDIKVYCTDYYDSEGMEKLAEVTKEEELLSAMENSETEAVCVKADITVNTDLTVKKPLFIDSGYSLTMADGAAVLDYGNFILLKEYASLHGNAITLQEDAQLYMEGNSQLIVDENGSLTLDSSILTGWGADIKLNGAVFSLKNRAGIAFQEIKSLEIYKSEIILQNKSVFALSPFLWETINISDSSILLSKEGEPSYFYTVSDVDINDCSLQIDAGMFRNTARSLSLQNCSVTIAQEGELVSENSNLSLLSGTALHNEGYFNVSGWNDFRFTVHGEMDNYGTIEFGICYMELSEPINNQQKVYYSESSYRTGDCDWNDAYVTGNAPINIDTLQ